MRRSNQILQSRGSLLKVGTKSMKVLFRGRGHGVLFRDEKIREHVQHHHVNMKERVSSPSKRSFGLLLPSSFSMSL